MLVHCLQAGLMLLKIGAVEQEVVAANLELMLL